MFDHLSFQFRLVVDDLPGHLIDFIPVAGFGEKTTGKLRPFAPQILPDPLNLGQESPPNLLNPFPLLL